MHGSICRYVNIHERTLHMPRRRCSNTLYDLQAAQSPGSADRETHRSDSGLYSCHCSRSHARDTGTGMPCVCVCTQYVVVVVVVQHLFTTDRTPAR